MITLMRKFPALLFALVALVAVSCNTNDDPNDPNGTKPNAPSSLKAQSRSETSVALMWDAPAGGVTPTGYRVYFNVSGQVTKDSLSVTGASTTIAVLTALIEGSVYDFSVAALNGSVVGNATAALSWAPARRAGMTTTLKLYSSNSVLFGSGLAIFKVGAPQVLMVSQGGLWDLAYDDKIYAGHPNPTIASPGQTDYVHVDPTTLKVVFDNGSEARIVFLGRQYVNTNSLDDIWETAHLNDATLDAQAEYFYDLTTPGGSGGLGFVFASKDPATGKFNYGKALVLRTNGTFIQGSSPDTYIELQISYQTGADVPYAVRAAVEAAEIRAKRINTPGLR